MQSPMSLRKSLLFILLTTVFRLVGSQAELGQPVQQVQVKVGDTAVLPCNVSAYMNGETEDGLYIRWVTNDGPVCDFTKGKSYPSDDYHNRTEISKEENSKRLYHLIINETRLSDYGEYHCNLQKPERNEDVASVQLIVQGSQAELGQPIQQVQVTVGDTAVLPCNVSAPMNGETEDGLYIWWDTNDGPVCEFAEGKSYCYGDYHIRTEISKEKNSEHLYHLIINETRLLDNEKYSCKLQKPGGNVEDVASVQLIVQGLMENRELHEGDNLTIPLGCLSSPYIEFCGPAGNLTADGVCQGLVERLTVQNGSLTLSNVTAKDQGKYIVREKMGGRTIRTLTLKTKPVGTQHTGWHWSVGVIAGIFALLLLVYISVRAIKWYKRRQMEREMRRLAEQLNEQIPLSEIKSSGDVEEK